MKELLLGDPYLGCAVTLQERVFVVRQGAHSGCIQSDHENTRDEGESKRRGLSRTPPEITRF